MKICIISYDVFGLGGVQRVIANIANRLVQEHDVDIIITKKININKNYYNINLDKIRVKYVDIFKDKSILYRIKRKLFCIILKVNYKFNFKWINNICCTFYFEKNITDNLVEIINSSNYDYVIGCSLRINLLLGAIRNKISSKVFGWEHNAIESYLEKPSEFHYQLSIIRFYLNKLDRIILITDIEKQKVKTITSTETIVIPNPISFKSVEKSLLNNNICIYAGRLSHDKGIMTLLNIFLKFTQYYKDWELHIIGEGPLKEDIESFISEYDLFKNIKLFPFTTNIKEYLISSTLNLCTSSHESFGLTILEAMECGVPTISFPTSGPSELIINNKTGIIVDTFSEKMFLEALKNLCSNPELLKIFSENSIKRAQEYDIDNIYDKWSRILVVCEEEGL